MLIDVEHHLTEPSPEPSPQRRPNPSPTASRHSRHATVTEVNQPTVTVSGGDLRGVLRNDIAVFKGITYAEAERFAHSGLSDQRWSGVRDADTYGPQALQVPGTMELLLGESSQPTAEDCLTLNVFAPTTPGPHPVLVWIHGGAFTNGAGSVPWYDGTNIASLGDLVVVTINYRLGAFGFLGHSNVGLGDQLNALRWVRNEIAAFGGDPSQVTIMGESAGGCSVIALMATPGGRDLFHRAIALSPSLPQIRAADRSDETVAETLRAAGVDDVDALRALPGDALLAAQAAMLGGTSDALTAFSPTAGGDLLPSDVHAAAALDPRPLMIGTTRDEMHLFCAFDPAITGMDDDAVQRRFAHLFDDTAHVLDVYRSHRDDHNSGQLFSAIRTDAVFRRPAHRLADARWAHGHQSFMHWFTFPTPVFGGVLGSCHALDIPFALANLDRTGVELFTGTDERRAGLAATFAGAVSAFARKGDPGWATWDDRRVTQVLNLDSQCGVDIIEDPEPSIRELWADANAG